MMAMYIDMGREKGAMRFLTNDCIVTHLALCQQTMTYNGAERIVSVECVLLKTKWQFFKATLTPPSSRAIQALTRNELHDSP